MNLHDIIIEESPDWIALNKPSGLLSIPDREGKEASLKQILTDRYGRIFTVHRLDKDTSGLILFAKNEKSHAHLSMQFEERQTVKIYQGLVLGSLQEKEGTVDAPIAAHPVISGQMVIHRKGKQALTDYRVNRDFRLFSWLEFRIHTGRTHQIRVHMKHLGHPVACDPLYGDGKPLYVSSFRSHYKLSRNEEEERPILNRLALHAYSLGFRDLDAKEVTLEAALPKDLRATLQQLEKSGR
jgi:23S rRNA pseudouridine955/2504/2580 synthase/23S rRNA pseudouridine1911/1915/1917 synthase